MNNKIKIITKNNKSQKMKNKLKKYYKLKINKNKM